MSSLWFYFISVSSPLSDEEVIACEESASLLQRCVMFYCQVFTSSSKFPWYFFSLFSMGNKHFQIFYTLRTVCSQLKQVQRWNCPTKFLKVQCIYIWRTPFVLVDRDQTFSEKPPKENCNRMHHEVSVIDMQFLGAHLIDLISGPFHLCLNAHLTSTLTWRLMISFFFQVSSAAWSRCVFHSCSVS